MYFHVPGLQGRQGMLTLSVPDVGTIKKWAKQRFAVHYNQNELVLPMGLNSKKTYALIKEPP